MFLKSLEIRGFKSFADKTEITFNKGVTAVVGPNGSGKSNISDAVRWVLGEQSIKTLRGGKMEDVIFAGTQYRKPVGLAQVAITLDNNNNEIPIDYSYVTIARRLYRSGESEYYINNSKCRLKDIQELFMDTGIGKEGYSIIGQGKIDAILNGKPEDRRKLLEEAAGIVKFKTRKEEAEKKLVNTVQNLTRIEDILNTYEERLGPLEIEKNKANEFLKLSQDLKIKEINIIIHNVNYLEEKILNIKSIINKLNNEVNVYLKNKDEYKIKYEKLENKLDEFNKHLEEKKEDYYNRQSEHKDVLSEINILKERYNNLESYIQNNFKELNELVEKNKIVHNEKNLKESDLENHQKEQLELNNKIVKLENELLERTNKISSDEKELNKFKNRQVDVLSKIYEFRNNKLIFDNQIEELQKKLMDIKNSCEGYINSIKINLNTKQELENEKNKILEIIDGYNEDIKSSKKERNKLNIKLKDLEINLKNIHKRFNTLEANRNILINLEKEYEGYTRTVKNLMHDLMHESIGINKDSCHVLGEILEVPKELEVAVEIALGASISNIITKDETTAKKLIEYLKQNKLGRATFLPLDIIKGKKIILDSNIKNIDGYIGIASELVLYEKVFESIFQYILGRTIIAKNLDAAIKIAKKTGFRFKIVTLEGEVVNPGGALTGGSLHLKNTGIISRKRKIEEIEEQLHNLKATIDENTLNLENCHVIIKNLDDKCLNLRDNVHYKNIEITKIDGKINAINKETEKLNKGFSVSKEEINIINKDLQNKNEEVKKIIENIDIYHKEKKQNEYNIMELENRLKNVVQHIESDREKLMELRIKKAQLDEIVNNKITELNRLGKEIESIQNKITYINNEIEKSKNKHNNIVKEIEQDKYKIKDILVLLDSMENLFKEKEIEKIKIKEDLEFYKNKLQQIELLISAKDKEIHKQQLANTKYQTEKDSIYLKLNDEFQITYAEALEYKFNKFDIEELKNNIEELKICISNLGVVNLGSIKEYEEIQTKYNFMNGQKEDLTKAREELMEVINHMTTEMRTMFNDNFSKLRVYFNETFKELFKGGRADLILGKGDELSCDIEINVEPPGKKLQNINLMSGGEKVLSAIALLFAILKMKPTPFCILDEIEAALDDANVIRYAEFLKVFSSNVQFIVITHRKGTMEASDAMYGVTMQEKGISKIVSIDLKN